MATDKDAAGTGTGSKSSGTEKPAATKSAGTGSSSSSSAASAGKRPVTIDLKAEAVGGKAPAASQASATGQGTSAAGSKAPSASAASSSASAASATKPSVPGAAKTSVPPTSSDKTASPAKAVAAEPEKTAAGEKLAAAVAGEAGKSSSSSSPSSTSSSSADSSASGTGTGSGGSSGSGSGNGSSGSGAASKPSVASVSAGEQGSGVVAMISAGLFGGLVVLAGAYGLHSAGVLKFGGGADERVDAVLSRVAGLEEKVQGLETTGTTVTENAQKLDQLQEKIETVDNASRGALSGLETAIGELRSSIGGQEANGEAQASAQPAPQEGGAAQTAEAANAPAADLSGLESRIASVETLAKAAQAAVASTDAATQAIADSQAKLGETVSGLSASLKTASDEQGSALSGLKGEIEALSARVAAVEKTMGDATAREVAARALSVSALRSAVDSGQPFETELAAVKAGLPDGTDLSALDAYAAKGIESRTALIAEFPGVARSMFDAFSAPERSGDMLDNLLSGAKSLIAVRGPGDADGTGPEAVLRRMEDAVAKGDLEAAVAEFPSLPEEAKTIGEPWVNKTKARISADKLTAEATQELLSALGKKSN